MVLFLGRTKMVTRTHMPREAMKPQEKRIEEILHKSLQNKTDNKNQPKRKKTQKINGRRIRTTPNNTTTITALSGERVSQNNKVKVRKLNSNESEIWRH